MTRTPKIVSNRLLMGKCSRTGFPDPNKAGRGSPRPDRVRGDFYTFVARDGQARWTGVQIGRQAEVSQLGWGGFSW